jgi:hypothetical protein
VFAGGITVGAPSPSLCSSDSIRVVPSGIAITISPSIAAPVGSILYLYQTVTYRFAASGVLPGRTGLWRQAGTAAAQEMISPFDSTAGFRCLVGARLLPVDCLPAGGADSVRGIELRLIGASEHAAQGRTTPERFDLTTSIPFVNRLPN